jgi:hypothetical protein
MKKIFIVTLLASPLFVHAQEYKFLVDPPGFIGAINTSGGLIAYINALFNLAVLIGGVLAVFIIASAGLQYMTTDAILQKSDAKKRIQNALIGLIMLLSIWIFFNQINPDILKLKGFDLPKADTTSTSTSQTQQSTGSSGVIRNSDGSTDSVAGGVQ